MSNDITVAITILTAATAFLLIAAVGALAVRIFKAGRFQPLLLLFLTLPAGQLFLLYSFRYETWTVFWLLGVFLGLLADGLLLLYAISQERKITAEEELKELQHRMSLERSHYDSVQERREQLADIRASFYKRLDAVSKLAENGKDESARDMIAALADQISQTNENTYCAIPVVNAILADKQKECDAADVGLSVNLVIPGKLSVSPMHLCSIFSNILDNAIAASQKAQVASKPMIRLSSLTDGDYLFIKATNPSQKPPKKPSPGRGYGFRILSELAKRYGGKFTTDYRDGIFTVIVTVLAYATAEEQ